MAVSTIVGVEIDIIKEKKDGSGTYKATVLEYTNEKGETKTKIIPTGILKFNPTLMEKIEELKEGQKVTFKWDDNFNITDVLSPQESKSSFGGSKKSFGKSSFTPNSAERDVGMQVGNALNVGSILLANKVISGTLQEAAEMVLTVGENLKKRLLAGEFSNSTSADTSKATQKKPRNDRFLEEVEL